MSYSWDSLWVCSSQVWCGVCIKKRPSDSGATPCQPSRCWAGQSGRHLQTDFTVQGSWVFPWYTLGSQDKCLLNILLALSCSQGPYDHVTLNSCMAIGMTNILLISDCIAANPALLTQGTQKRKRQGHPAGRYKLFPFGSQHR